jgi:hypothetical protein
MTGAARLARTPSAQKDRFPLSKKIARKRARRQIRKPYAGSIAQCVKDLQRLAAVDPIAVLVISRIVRRLWRKASRRKGVAK